MRQLNAELTEGVRAAFAAALRPGDGWTNGGQAMARIIFSAFNFENRCSVGDLCALDAANYAHALAVIEARFLGLEPHEVYPEAEADMDKLREKYAHLMQD